MAEYVYSRIGTVTSSNGREVTVKLDSNVQVCLGDIIRVGKRTDVTVSSSPFRPTDSSNWFIRASCLNNFPQGTVVKSKKEIAQP